MSFRKYAEYKEIGVEWLGEVPKHWVIGKVKYVTENLDKSRVPLSSLERGKRPGIYPYYGASGIIDYIDDYLFDEDTILFGEDGANLLARSTPLAFLATGKYWVNNHAHVLKAKDGLNRFWVMVLENIDITPVVSGSAQPKLTSEALGNLNVVYPPSIDERREILAFLDKETTKIDTLIDKQEQLITLLQEKRQAIISHAVTRGLNPNVKMKDSGIEWLGEVPEHWEVRRLKFCVHLTDQKIEANREKPLPYVGLENIQSWTGKLLPIDPNVVPTSVANRFGKGMTLFGKLRPYLAKACNPDFEGLCSTELLVFKSTGFDRRLLLYLLLTDGFIKVVDSSTYGAKMPRANWDFIGNCIVPVPPLEEQKQIVAFLDKETTKINTLIEKCETAIELLKERRTALISAAVTGKIDVRNAV